MALVPRDKALHVLAGALLFAAGHRMGGLPAGAAFSVGGGLLKELVDRGSGRGSAETADFLATCAGGLLAALLLRVRAD